MGCCEWGQRSLWGRYRGRVHVYEDSESERFRTLPAVLFARLMSKTMTNVKTTSMISEMSRDVYL